MSGSSSGWNILGCSSALSPYLRGHMSRFGAYATDELTHQPEAFNPVLKEVDFTTLPVLERPCSPRNLIP